MLSIQSDLLTQKHNRPALRDHNYYTLREMRGVIAHWTANTDKGADAQANRNYFNNHTDRDASAHYVVDDHSIIQCIPDNEVAYHVGANVYKADGQRIIADTPSLTPNYYVVGFEMCVNSDGDWDKTYQNSVDLAAHLLRKHGFTTNDLYRHYDITGKDCPNMLLTAATWGKFKSDVATAMKQQPATQIAQGKTTPSGLNVRSGSGVSNNKVDVLPKGSIVDIYENTGGWMRIGPGRWVSGSYVDVLFTTRWVQLSSRTDGNVYQSAVTTAKVVDALPKGIWTQVVGEKGDWYQLGASRWIKKSVTQVLGVQNGEVIDAADLNVRLGPATSYDVSHQLHLGNKVLLFGEQGSWYRIANREWVAKRYIKVL
ncbi:MAG: SH3 domain-containing protein [Saprospiraceae bacterium]